MSFDRDVRNWTYGCEHELGDWDRQRTLPEGFSVDDKDVTVMNSNGIAADPKGKLYGFGGELCTPPTRTVLGQLDQLTAIRERYPEATVNHRSNLHVHVRVPGLAQDLPALKRIAAWARAVDQHQWAGRKYIGLLGVLDLVEPIPKPSIDDYRSSEVEEPEYREEYDGAMRRYRRRLVSHHTVITEARLSKQLRAETVQDFFAAEAPTSAGGMPLWHLAPRHAVNLRHLREETETVEFRHFPGTLNEVELHTAIAWCRDYLMACLGQMESVASNPLELYNRCYKGLVPFPRFPPYQHWREVRYRKTCHDGTLTKDEIKANIEAILAEDAQECPF